MASQIICLLSSQVFFFFLKRPWVIVSVASLPLASLKLLLGQRDVPCRECVFFLSPLIEVHNMYCFTRCQCANLLTYPVDFSSAYSSHPRRWLLLRKVWPRWTRLAWKQCLPSSVPRPKQKRSDFCIVCVFVIKKRKCRHVWFHFKWLEWEETEIGKE